MITYVQVLNEANKHSRRIKLSGLDPKLRYRDQETGKEYFGDTLMNAGLLIPRMWGDFQAKLISLKAV